ncbi:LegC family aminotransferase [Paremcibacter congregatus]|uniref:LegC family aminotransferase n=1 Tax=Paremcibacter congregatus TaxID=2043170 RepID=UPI003C6DC256
MYKELIEFVREIYLSDSFLPLHEPRFVGNEKKYVNEAIDSTFVSSVGAFVDRFEESFASYHGVEKAVACMNGTAALHTALVLANVRKENEVITQPLTFVATCNAISYQGAHPIFIDVDRDTLGLSPQALEEFLVENAEITAEGCLNKTSGRIIKAVVPMHTFGHACRIDEIATICQNWHITLIEDAAEALGSQYKGQALGTFGDISAYSFNGNKIITTGGGGMIIARNSDVIKKAKHLTTTAKIPHLYEFTHDEVGFNYRMPNLNAALGCAQLEQLDSYLASKRKVAKLYKDFFSGRPETFVDEPEEGRSNFWLNAILLADDVERDHFLKEINKQNIMVRPIWTLMNKLPMFESSHTGPLVNAVWLEKKIVNLPSSVRL